MQSFAYIYSNNHNDLVFWLVEIRNKNSEVEHDQETASRV